MSFVKSEKNVADIFSKPLVVHKFMNLRKYIMANVSTKRCNDSLMKWCND